MVQPGEGGLRTGGSAAIEAAVQKERFGDEKQSLLTFGMDRRLCSGANFFAVRRFKVTV